MRTAVANLPIENFPTPVFGGTPWNGYGTFSYAPGYYPTTTTTTTTTTAH